LKQPDRKKDEKDSSKPRKRRLLPRKLLIGLNFNMAQKG
jgi:hypothetical protein